MTKVLIVDDDPGIRNIIKMGLKRYWEKCNYTVTEAENGKEALEKFKKEKGNFDYIILDLIMPIEPGQWFLEKAKDSLSGINCFLFTSCLKTESDVRICEIKFPGIGYVNKAEGLLGVKRMLGVLN